MINANTLFPENCVIIDLIPGLIKIDKLLKTYLYLYKLCLKYCIYKNKYFVLIIKTNN